VTASISIRLRQVAACGVACVLSLSAVVGSAPASAQAYPAKSIQIVVPFPPGGSSDIIARQLSVQLSELLKQSVIVDNRPGAGTLIGTNHVANAAPDGYTLLLADVPFTVNPSVVKSARYDPVKDFTPIAIIGASAQFLYSNPSRFQSLNDFIAAAKRDPGKVSVANAGSGTTTHLMTEMLQSSSGVKLLQVQYKGSTPALTDTAAGHTDAVFSTLASAAALVNTEKLRVIGVTSKQRLESFPDVPTFAEIGASDMVVEHWWGLVGPAGIPLDVVHTLNKAIAEAVRAPAVQERFKALGVEPRTGTPESFREHIKSYVERWAQVVKDNKIEVN
jgi:tripartite-type tricarboxylate transporter receptor subunit TctC